MPVVEINDLEQLRKKIGQEIAVSDWVTITQERINLFADATDDHQWIHVDKERAAKSPFKGTIAHGFLTLSMLPHLMALCIAMPSAKMSVNYGLNRVRFTNPVPAGGRIRARVTLLKMEETNAGAMDFYWQVTIELEGSERPACIAETISRRYA